MKHLVRCFMVVLLLLHASAVRAFNVDTAFVTPTNVTGLWWNANESGWGATITQQGGVIFLTMFTYDGFANPTWYVASNCVVSADRCSGDLFRVTGGRAPTVSWVGATVNAVRVGSVTLSFSDNNNGSMNYSIDGVTGSKSITRQVFNSAPPPPPPVEDNRAKTERLLGGTWTFNYFIGSSGFTNRYSFTSIQASTAAPGDWNAFGRDEFGDTIIGGYSTTVGRWVLLDTGILIDRFFVFDFSNLNNVGGCYHQINPAGSTNLSQCYSMSGFRSPPKRILTLEDQVQLEMAEIEAVNSLPRTQDVPGPEVMEAYQKARVMLH